MAHAIRMQAPDVPHKTFWSDGVWAGLIAGIVFMMAEMILMMMLKGESPWGPPRMMAAMVLGQGVLPPPATFDFGVMMAAMMVHGVASIIYGLIGAWLVHRVHVGVALMIGAAFGLAIYIVNFHIVVPTLFSWFVMARGGISVFTHIMFGMVLAGAYVALRRRHVAPSEGHPI